MKSKQKKSLKMKIENFQKRNVHEFYKENNKVHEFFFSKRKVSVKNKKFMNFLFMFFRCK